MMSFRIILLLLIASASAWAIDDTPVNRAYHADRYLEAIPPKEMFADMAEQMAMNFPPEQREGFKALLTKHLDIEALTREMKASMIRHFSADELQALADFYGSAVGKSAMKKLPAYMADIMPGIEAEVGKAMAKANREKPDIPK